MQLIDLTLRKKRKHKIVHGHSNTVPCTQCGKIHGHPTEGRTRSQEERDKISKGNTGKRLTSEQKENMSIAQKLSYKNGKVIWNKGIKMSDEFRLKCSESHKVKPHPQKISSFKGRHHTEESKLKSSISHKKKFQDPEFLKRFAKGRSKASVKSASHMPNKFETRVVSIVNEACLSDEYKYNDGWIIIGNCIPDIVNVKDKKIIEANGCYYHKCLKCYPKSGEFKLNKDSTNERIKIYNSNGWDTLVIWEHEMKDIEVLKNKIIEFNDNK